MQVSLLRRSVGRMVGRGRSSSIVFVGRRVYLPSRTTEWTANGLQLNFVLIYDDDIKSPTLLRLILPTYRMMMMSEQKRRVVSQQEEEKSNKQQQKTTTTRIVLSLARSLAQSSL